REHAAVTGQHVLERARDGVEEARLAVPAGGDDARAVGRELDVGQALLVAAGDGAAAVARPGGAAQAAGVALEHAALRGGGLDGGGEEEAARGVVDAE